MLLMLQHQAHSRNRLTTTDEKGLLCFSRDFSGRYNFGRIIKIVATRCHILELNAPNSISDEALPHTPAGEKLTALPQTPSSWI